MANVVIFDKLGPLADRILDEFAARTGLTAHDEGSRRIFEVSSADDHEVRVVQTLTEIDEHWTQHIGLELP